MGDNPNVPEVLSHLGVSETVQAFNQECGVLSRSRVCITSCRKLFCGPGLDNFPFSGGYQEPVLAWLIVVHSSVSNISGFYFRSFKHLLNTCQMTRCRCYEDKKKASVLHSTVLTAFGRDNNMHTSFWKQAELCNYVQRYESGAEEVALLGLIGTSGTRGSAE